MSRLGTRLLLGLTVVLVVLLLGLTELTHPVARETGQG